MNQEQKDFCVKAAIIASMLCGVVLFHWILNKPYNADQCRVKYAPASEKAVGMVFSACGRLYPEKK